MSSVERLIEPLRRSPQYLLENGEYSLALKSGSGVLKCRAINGLTIPIEALYDEQANLQAIRKVLAE